jgi:LuxR family maltose regulon positive regulatory protein
VQTGRRVGVEAPDARLGDDRFVTAPRVTRSRLLARLDTARSSASVVVLSGPAGAGKSVLADQLLSMDDRHHAVVHLAPHTDEPIVLAKLLLDALQSLGVSTASARLSATAEEPAFSSVLLPAIANLVATAGKVPYVLVVDDVHLVHDRRCHELLRAVGVSVGPGSWLVLLTRGAAPEWLAKVRAEGRLVELGPGDLAFDKAEATRLFRDLGLQPDPAEIARLVEQVEGWAVGLYLTALAMRRRGGAQGRRLGSAPQGTDAFIGDYLRSEVLDPLDPAEQEFLLHSCVLDELTAGACDAVLEREDSAAVLHRLHRHNLLVVRLDERRFRCHHLLAEHLVAELQGTDPAIVPVLHRRAARWYAAQSDLDSAIRHAKQAGDLPLAAELIWSGIEACLGSGYPDRLRLWLADLSDREIGSEPWLTLAAAWSAEQSGDLDRMRRWLLRAETHAGSDWRSRMHEDTYAASLATLVGIVGKAGLEDSVVLCEGAFHGLPPASGFRAAAAFIRGVCLSLLRRPVEGSESLVEAQSLARALDVPLVQADALAWQGLMAIMATDYGRGSQLIAEARVLIERHHLDRMVTSAHCLTASALLLAMRHDPAAAATLAKARGLTATIRGVGPWLAVCGRLFQARAAVLLGDGALARLLIAEARSAMTPDLADSLAGDLLEDTATLFRAMSLEGPSGAVLTAAELRVLQFLPSHLSFPLIGEHLHLSQNTVKTQAISIYRKLGVTSRVEAVERARALGLVEGPTTA